MERYTYKYFLESLKSFKIESIVKLSLILDEDSSNLDNILDINFIIEKANNLNLYRFEFETNGTSWSQKSQIFENQKENVKANFVPLGLDELNVIVNKSKEDKFQTSALKFISFQKVKGKINCSLSNIDNTIINNIVL